MANTALQRAPWWVRTAAPGHLKTADVFSRQQLVWYFEAMARITLPVVALKSPGIGLMARAQIQRFVLRPSQAVRLLHAWATLLGPTGSCSYRPTPHDVKDLFLCLRPKQSNAGPCNRVGSTWPAHLRRSALSRPGWLPQRHETFELIDSGASPPLTLACGAAAPWAALAPSIMLP